METFRKVLDMHAIFDGLKQGIVLGVAVASLIVPPDHGARTVPVTSVVTPSPVVAQHAPRFAAFRAQSPPESVRHIADWVADSGDNHGMAFVIIDKKDARVWVFEPGARLLAASPVLLGAATGDDSVAGIGKRPMAEVRSEERTTPAGRFIAEPGRNVRGEDVIWVDYDAAVSMHRLRAVEPKERRQERLASPTPEDNRISYGCINVPPDFYDAVLKPVFDKRRGVVYVLPEAKPLKEVFASYDVAARYGGPRS